MACVLKMKINRRFELKTDLGAIVVVHRGNTRWLGRSLRSAKVSNPGVEIVLIGDERGRTVARDLGVVYFDWQDYCQSSDELAEDYVHRSTNGRDFELVCLQRWLVLESWVQEHCIENLIAIDSDILVFTELAKVLKDVHLNGVGFVYDSAHLAWIQSRSSLTAICDVIRNAYADSSHRLVNHLYEKHIETSMEGGVSDMSFFGMLSKNGSGLVQDIRGPHGDRRWCFDVTMNDAIGGFELKGGLKAIRWIDRIPHALLSDTKDWLPFATLHFQGKAKAVMPQVFRRVHGFWTPAIAINDSRLFTKKIVRRLKSSLISFNSNNV